MTFIFNNTKIILTICSDIKENVATSFSIMDLILPKSGIYSGLAVIVNFNLSQFIVAATVKNRALFV